MYIKWLFFSYLKNLCYSYNQLIERDPGRPIWDNNWLCHVNMFCQNHCQLDQDSVYPREEPIHVQEKKL